MREDDVCLRVGDGGLRKTAVRVLFSTRGNDVGFIFRHSLDIKKIKCFCLIVTVNGQSIDKKIFNFL